MASVTEIANKYRLTTYDQPRTAGVSNTPFAPFLTEESSSQEEEIADPVEYAEENKDLLNDDYSQVPDKVHKKKALAPKKLKVVKKVVKKVIASKQPPVFASTLPTVTQDLGSNQLFKVQVEWLLFLAQV